MRKNPILFIIFLRSTESSEIVFIPRDRVGVFPVRYCLEMSEVIAVGSKAAPIATETEARLFDSFDDMPLRQELLRGIYSVGFETPSHIQQRAIVPIVSGRDVIAQAQSGTGKTGAFAIGLLQRIDWRRATVPQALVISPTRELAEQTCDVVRGLASYLTPFSASCTFTGGTGVQGDVQKLRAGVAVAVGTPGRIADLIKRGALQTAHLGTVVLDEADELLSQGFAEQISNIFRFLPREIQVCLVSATMPSEVLELADRFMRSPTRILVPRDELTLEALRQYCVLMEEADKIHALSDLYETVSIAQSVIFANTRRKVEWIAAQLNQRSHTVSAMHAEMARDDRSAVMRSFRSGLTRVLVTTDVVARGIDVQHVNYVINFDIPLSKESYLHRIGRSARHGRKGVAINFLAPRDVEALREIESHYSIEIPELPADFEKHLGSS